VSDEFCPNCEAPFSDLQMMGVGGNQASPRFQCGSIFVPVAKRLVVKTYACMKIAELRASIAKPAAVPEAVALLAKIRADVASYPRSLAYDMTCLPLIDRLAALLSAADTEVKK